MSHSVSQILIVYMLIRKRIRITEWTDHVLTVVIYCCCSFFVYFVCV